MSAFNVVFSSLLNDLVLRVDGDGLDILTESGRIHLCLTDEELGKLMFRISSYLQDKGK